MLKKKIMLNIYVFKELSMLIDYYGVCFVSSLNMSNLSI